MYCGIYQVLLVLGRIFNMENQTGKEDVFLFNLLKSLSSERQTIEEIREIYLRRFPPSFLERKLGLSTSQEKIQKALAVLLERGLITRELTRFKEGKPLNVDTPVYFINSAGTQALYLAKHKK